MQHPEARTVVTTAAGRRVAALVTLGAATMAATVGCYRPKRGGQAGAAAQGDAAPGGRLDAGIFTDPVRIYQRMGLLAEGGALPFVGNVAFFAAPSPDTTHTLVSVSMAANALSFQRDADRYRASYALQLQVRRNDTTFVSTESEEVVRVAVFKETTREDESIIAQRLLTLRPGFYTLVVTVRDAGTQRSSTSEVPLTVPRLEAPALSTPLAVLDAAPRATLDSLPRVVATPRATAVFGRDTVLPLYIEGYAAAARFPISWSVRSERGATLWTDTTSLPRNGDLFSGLVRVPVSRIGVGVATLVLWPTGAPDTVRTPVFVSFGENLPVTTFDEMLQYLRFFAAPERLQRLREAPGEARAEAWSRFLAETDPNTQTSVHEGLRDYFGRVRVANERFREEGSQGWMSDRGMVFVALGDPDQIYEQGASDVSQRGRAQIWEYRQHGLQLVFIDQSGFGRWRLTTSSEADFRSTLADYGYFSVRGG
jgi:GWxTD domain-containing protein